jgi:hypothetical protein
LSYLGGWVLLIPSPSRPSNVPLVIGSISPFTLLGGQAIQRGASLCPPGLRHGMCSFTGLWAFFFDPFIAPHKSPVFPPGQIFEAKENPSLGRVSDLLKVSFELFVFVVGDSERSDFRLAGDQLLAARAFPFAATPHEGIMAYRVTSTSLPSLKIALNHAAGS